MGIDSVVTEEFSDDLFSVVIRALTMETVVMGSIPGINNKQTSSELWIMGC